MKGDRLDIPAISCIDGPFAVHIRRDDDETPSVEIECRQRSRGIEAALPGKGIDLGGDLVSRICGPCSVSHRLALMLAIEDACGIEVSDTTRTLRELLLCASYLEDHADHILATALASRHGDGACADGHVRAADDDDDAKALAMRISQVGGKLVEIIGGRRIHPMTIVAGGFSVEPDKQELSVLGEQLSTLTPLAEELCDRVAAHEEGKVQSEGDYLALVGKDSYAVLSSTFATLLVPRTHEVSDLFDVLRDAAVSRDEDRSIAKREGRRPFHVGPIARVNHSWKHLDSRARISAAKAGLRPLCTNSFRAPLCEAIELVDMTLRCAGLCEDFLKRNGSSMPADVHVEAGEGCGVIESPRGILAQRVSVSSGGLIERFEVVDPAMINMEVLAHDISSLAWTIDDDATLIEEVRRLMRSYDLCSACLMR